MAQFLRDQRVESVTIDEGRIRQLAAVFQDMRTAVVEGLTPEQAREQWWLNYMIRFDGKGYRLWDIEEVLTFFNHADRVERLFFTLESRLSLNTNRLAGAYAELRLDAGNVDGCIIVATSDRKADADTAFATIEEPLRSAKNFHRFFRGSPMLATVQLLGVGAGFVLSLWGASLIASRLAVENAFPIAFLFVFVLFSNLWGYIHQWSLRRIDSLFPNIAFHRAAKDNLHWLWQTLVGSAVVAIVFAVVVKVFEFIGDALRPFLITR